jgi:hypothetical protein
MSRTEEEAPADLATRDSANETAVESARRPAKRPRQPPDARVALDLRDNSDLALHERLVEEDPREAEHLRRLEEERQAHLQSMELLRLKSSLALKRQNTPSELIKARAQAILAVGMGVLALGTLCYLLIRSDTPMDLKKDILKYVGGAIGGVGIGYALGKRGGPESDE